MKQNILKLAGILGAALIFTGCIKDKGFDDGTYQSLRYDAASQKVVSIAITTDVNSNVAQISVPASASASVVDLVPVTLAGGVAAEQDVHVVLDTMMSLVVPAGFVAPPTAKYSIVSKTVTIPKGQSTAYMQIRLNVPNDFIGTAYGIGVKIISVDGGYKIASNGKNQGVAAFAIANQYEGDYQGIGSIRYNYGAAPVAYNLGDPIPSVGLVNTTAIPSPKHISTIDANTVYIDFANLGAAPNSYGYIVTIPPGLSGNTDFTVPTVLNANALAGNSLIEFKQHTYNPSTKTFKFVVLYNNNATGTGLWRLLFETLKKI